MLKKDRLAKVFKNLEKQNLTQMVISDPHSIFYLTGRWIHPGERMLALYINANGNNKIFINELFTVPEDLGVEKVWFSDVQDGAAMLAEVIDHSKPLGIDKIFVAKFLLRLMELNAATGYVNSSIAVDAARMVKDAEEIELMRAASILNDKAIARVLPLLKEGVSEIEVSDQVSAIYREMGAEGLSFDTIIEFGPNCAIGHHEPNDTKLKAGDCIIVDMGCRLNSYCSDMTRTFYCKFQKEKEKELYDICNRAVDAAMALVKPGAIAKDIDNAARKVITDAGYGPYFTHRTGHFIGIEDHDFGDISSVSEIVLEPGMIFSIEPGIYLVDDCGVRIEDLVMVTEDGYEDLNAYTREVIVLD